VFGGNMKNPSAIAGQVSPRCSFMIRAFGDVLVCSCMLATFAMAQANRASFVSGPSSNFSNSRRVLPNPAAQSTVAKSAQLPPSQLFRAATTYNVAQPSALAVGDLNGDNFADVAVVNSEGLGVLVNNGDGTFKPVVNYALTGQLGTAVAIGDVNGDGKQDAIVALACSDAKCVNGAISVLLGNGDGTFQAATSYSSGGYYTNSLALVDMNHDGKLDVVTGSACAIGVQNCTGLPGLAAVMLGNGDGTFQAPVTTNVASAVGSMTIGDLNGDGSPDVVVTNESDVSVFLNNGDGTFQAAVNYAPGGLYPDSVAVADVNEDGKLDVIATNGCADSSCVTGSVGVLLGHGDGTLAAAIAQPIPGFALQFGGAGSLAVQDTDGDGHLDLVVGSACECQTSVAILFGKGDGTFTPGTLYGTGGYQIYFYASVAFADVNNDHKPDLVVADLDFSLVSVLLGDGDGTFQAGTISISGGTDPASALVADVNGDGTPDLVVGNLCADISCFFVGDDPGSGVVGVLLGNGDGTFQPAIGYPSGGSIANGVAVGDVNGDGIPDILVANECTNCTGAGNHGAAGDGVLGVLLGKGSGAFQSATTFDLGVYGGYSVAIGDGNGDGKPDAFVAESNGVAILIGNGDGSFQSPVNFASGGSGPRSLVLADVNGDGKLDVLVANECSNGTNCSAPSSVGILLGNGDGSYQEPVTYESGGNGSYAIAAGDVNGDGFLDVLVVNDQCSSASCSGGSIGVLLGNGDGTFRAGSPVAIPFSSWAGPFGEKGMPLALADFNGDGKLDIAFAAGNVLMLGNGEGTFQSPSTIGASGPAVAVGDFNNSGSPDIVIGVNANVTVLQNISVAPTGVSVASSSNPAVAGQSVTFSASVTSHRSVQPTGTVTFSDGANVLGTATISQSTATLSSASLGLGTHSISAMYGGDSHYMGSTSTALIQIMQVLPPSFQVSASAPTPSLVQKGQSTTSTVTVTSINGFMSTVQFACSIVPAGPTCTLDPTSVSLEANGTATSLLTVKTTSLSSSRIGRGWPGAVQSAAMSATCPMLALIAVTFVYGKRKDRFRYSALLLLLVAGLGQITACGEGQGPPPPPPQTYTVTVTATQGALNSTTTLTLMVD
jgi:hypothetical protein